MNPKHQIIKRLFSACHKHRDCTSCRGAYWDDDTQVICTCDHHHQGRLFKADRVEKKQGELF